MMYAEAAELTNVCDHPEPEEEYADELPSDYRMANVLPNGPVVVEREVDSGPGWSELARFTHEHAGFEWANELAEGLSNDELRVVYCWDVNEWLLEVFDDGD